MEKLLENNCINIINSFQIYNAEFEKFFLENNIVSKKYAIHEKIDKTGDNIIKYIHKGNVKIYYTNYNGDEIFAGYLPRHSIYFHTSVLPFLDKYSVANEETEIFYCLKQDFLKFISEKADRMQHVMQEPYYRRNLNELPYYETMNRSTTFKVSYYIYYLAIRFGVSEAGGGVTIYYPPMNKDIASFYGISSNNVSSVMAKLKKDGTLKKEKDKLIVTDLKKLEKMLE